MPRPASPAPFTPGSPRRTTPLAAALAALLLVSGCLDDPTGTPRAPGGPRLATGSSETNISNLGGNRVLVTDMNDAGEVVGRSRYSDVSPNHYYGFVWERGRGMRGAPVERNPGWYYASSGIVFAINGSGTMVGEIQSDSLEGPYRLSRSGRLEMFPGGYGHQLFDINDAGDATGAGYQGDGYWAFVWTAVGEIITLEGVDRQPLKINNAGQVLVRGGWWPVLWQNGTRVELRTLGGSMTTARDLNDAGQVVGHSYVAGDGAYHAFLWSAGAGMRDLGTLGGTNSEATAVNASGQVVGWSDTADGMRRAFLWTPEDGMRDLGTLPAVRDPARGEPGRPWSHAYDVNDAGEVTGYSTTGYTSPTAILWTETGGMQALGPGIGQVINNRRQVAGGYVFQTSHPSHPPYLYPVTNGEARFWHDIVVNTPPVADAGGPYAGTEGEPVLLDARASTDADGDEMAFAWDVDGDGAPDSSGTQVSHVFAIPGTYAVRLFVTDEAGAARTDDATVTVGPQRLPSAVIVLPPGGAYTGAEGGLVTFSSAGSAAEEGGRLLYRWDFGDGTSLQSRFQSTPFNPGKRYDDDGAYTARLIVWDTLGRSDTAAVAVRVRNTAPTAALTFPSTVYENADFTLSLLNPADSSGADRAAGFAFAFDCGTGSGYGAFGAAASAPCRSRVDQGTYVVGAKIRDKDGGVREYTAGLTTRNARPAITSATWSAGVLTVSFTDQGTNDAPWRWIVQWGDGTRSSGHVHQQGSAAVQAPHAYAGSGPFTALVYVYDKDLDVPSPIHSVTITP